MQVSVCRRVCRHVCTFTCMLATSSGVLPQVLSTFLLGSEVLVSLDLTKGTERAPLQQSALSQLPGVEIVNTCGHTCLLFSQTWLLRISLRFSACATKTLLIEPHPQDFLHAQ